LSSISTDAVGSLMPRARTAAAPAGVKAEWVDSDPALCAGDSAIGLSVDTSSAEAAGLTTSSHGARSMGASIDGAVAAWST